MKDPKAAHRVADLAERWSCSAGHIYGMIHSGKLRSFKIGTLLRISADEVNRIEGGEESLAAEPNPWDTKPLPR